MDNITKFRYYLSQGNRKNRTIELHMSCLTRLIRNIGTPSFASVVKYLLSLKDQGRKGTYLNDYVDLMHLWDDCFGTHEFDELTYFPEEEFMQATMSDEEIEAFLSLEAPVVTRKSKWGTVDTYVLDRRWGMKTLFWKIMAWTGMRPGEVAHIRVQDVDFGRNVFLLHPEWVKTNDYRLVPIPPRVKDELQEYIRTLSGEHLFPAANGGVTRQGGVINDVAWGYDFHQRIKRLGIKRNNLRPYSLRPSFITRLLAEDVSIFKVQRIVGHSRIDTTAHYTHLVTKDLQDAIEKDPMAAKGLKKTKLLQQELDRIRQFKKSFGDLLKVSIKEMGNKKVIVEYEVEEDLTHDAKSLL